MDNEAQETEVLSFRVDGALKRRLDRLRDEHSINLSDYVRKALVDRIALTHPELATQGEGGQ